MRRRELLSLIGTSLLVPGLARAGLAGGAPGVSPASGKTVRKGDPVPRLVLVELAGANDGLNTLVPRENDHYRRLRPTLSIAPDALLPFDSAHGLHPALRPLVPTLEAGELAVVQGLGYPRPNRSHFRSIALWERAGDGTGAPRADGWMTHAVEHGFGARDLDADGMSLSGGLSLFASEGGRWLSAESVAQLLTRIAPPPDDAFGSAHVARVAARLASLDATLERIGARLEGAPDMAPLSPNGLGEQLRQVARFVAAGLDVPVYRVRLAGFDTHENQLGRHAALLEELASALGAFRERMRELGEWGTTTVASYSEFGRRVAENASGGTDHGTAAPHVVLGGRVAGGPFGEAPDLAPERLVDGDPVHTMDYRALYAALLGGALGIGDPHLERFRDARLASLIGAGRARSVRVPRSP